MIRINKLLSIFILIGCFELYSAQQEITPQSTFFGALIAAKEARDNFVELERQGRLSEQEKQMDNLVVSTAQAIGQIPHIDVNQLGPEGRTPLIASVIASNQNVIEQLLQVRDLDIDLKDSEGNTALIHSIMKRNTPILELLLGQKASTHIPNSAGTIPLDIAMDIAEETKSRYDQQQEEGSRKKNEDAHNVLRILARIHLKEVAAEARRAAKRPLRESPTLAQPLARYPERSRSDSPIAPLLQLSPGLASPRSTLTPEASPRAAAIPISAPLPLSRSQSE